MKIYNQGKYISDLQMKQILNLLPIQIRTLQVKIYITTTEEFFTRNHLTTNFEKEVRRILETASDGGFFFYENSIVIFEDLIIHRYSDTFFTWNFVYLLVHELRHCEQATFFQERWEAVMSDYHLDYFEQLLDDPEKLHWSEKDAYTYAYRFVENNKNEIMDIFQLNTLHDFYPIDFEIDMEEIWGSYKKEMTVIERILWFIGDLYWPEKQMSKLHHPLTLTN